MGFRIHRGIFQKLNDARTAYENTFKIDDDGRIKEVDSEGNVTAGYLKVGEQATDADTVDGFHATNSAGGLVVLNSSNGYWNAPSWVHFNEGRGIYSGHNGAHLLPNNQGQYGAWRMIGTRNGWEGLHFGNASGMTLMMNQGESGVHKNGTGWKYRHQGGKFYVHDGTNGGGTSNEVWHTGTFTTTQKDLLVNTLQITGLPYTCDIVLNGDPDMYYPVHFFGGNQDVWRRIIIRRGYGEQAPWDPIGTGSHRGGLLLDWEGNFGGWGGAQYSDRLRVLNQSYTDVVADMYRTTHSMGYTFFLRGGGDTGAIYHIYSDQPINGYGTTGVPQVGYTTDTLFYNHSRESYRVFAPAALSSSQINRGRLDDLKTLKRSQLDDLYQPVGSYLTTSGKAADSNLLDGINSSQFLRSDAADTTNSTLTSTNTLGFRVDGSGSARIEIDGHNNWAYTRLMNAGSVAWDIAVYNNGDLQWRPNGGETNRMRLTKGGDLYVTNDVNSDEVRSRNYWIGNALYFGGGNNYMNWSNSNRIYTNAPMQVAGTTSGMALQVGNGSTTGVYTDDAARNALVVGASYYPHVFISASASNNTNHGAVLSFVGKEGTTARQWNMGTSNQNPFLFSIGYNSSGNNNPHYGLGDDWNSTDAHHARLLIDRDGNVKIRGSLYVDGTRGNITTGSKVATEAWVASRGYLTSETDSQTLTFNSSNGELTISNGNTVDLDSRYLDATSRKTWYNINAASQQAKRYTIGRVYYCPAHWDDTWMNIEFKLTEESYSGAYVKYSLFGFYNGSQNQTLSLEVTDYRGLPSDTRRYNLHLGEHTAAGWNHSNQPVYYSDIYVDVSYYKALKVMADTLGHSWQSTEPTSGAAITVFYGTPRVQDIEYTNVEKENTYVGYDTLIWNTNNFSSTNVSNWNTAHGWGNHASAGYLTSVPNHSAALITSGRLDGARLPWNDNDGFSGTYPIVWTATDGLYRSSWLKVRGSDDTLLTRSIDADGNVIANNFYVANAIYHEGDTNTYIQFEGDRIRIAAGGTVKFDSNSTYVTTGGSQTISGDKTFTSNSLTLKGHMYFNEHSAGRHYIHFKAAGSTNQVDWRIQTNSSNTIIHSWSERNALFRTNLETTGTVTATGGNSTEWNTAYDWGNHASAGYLTSVPSEYLTQTEGDARYLGISAKAADSNLIDGVDSTAIVYGGAGRASTYTASMDDTNQKSGFYYHDRATGEPTRDWCNWMTVAGNSWQSSNNYSFQLAHAFHSDLFYVRRMTNGSAGSWREIIDSGNIGSQTVAVAGTANAVAWSNVTSKPSTFTPSAHTHNFITNTTSYVASGALQSWDRQESTPDLNPTTDWFTALRIGHGHPVDYYSNTLAIQMTGGDVGRIYTRNIGNGNKGTWKKYWHGGDFTSTNISNWNTAYGWGNHATQGYVTSVTGALGYTPYQEGTALSASTIDGGSTLKVQAGHNDARMVIAYNHNGDSTSEYSGNLVMWTSEPGISYPGSGIGGNIHESGHYYGKRNTNIPYGVALRFNVTSGRAEFQTTASTNNGSFRVGWYMDSNGNTVQQGTITASGYNKSNWDTAYGWGNHSSAGYLTSVPNLAASKITSGTFANARISQSSVTQHQSALSIAASQVSGLPAATPPVEAFVEGGEPSTLSSITFDPGTGSATFTLADGQTFRLAFAR